MFAPEFGVEVESDEFDGFAEALAGWDDGFGWDVEVLIACSVRRAPFDRLRMAGMGRTRTGRLRMPFDRLRMNIGMRPFDRLRM